jgi:site-specific recombinase XerD
METVVEKLGQGLDNFTKHLLMREKALTTVNKYVRDIKKFSAFLQKNQRKKFGKQDVFDYKDYLVTQYKMTTVNSFIIS